ncbi:MAG: PLP-dependent aminotransferase family protein, partial [Bradyrhizobiaceae bacterium]
MDAMRLSRAALKAGVSINPGPEWSVDQHHAHSRIRICFASPTHQDIRDGIAVLADVCRTEFGVPERIANVARAKG